MANPLNFPSSPGLYFARQSYCNWWHLIVQISGEAPFLLVARVWDRKEDRLTDNPRQLYKIVEFGPEIVEPPAPEKIEKLYG